MSSGLLLTFLTTHLFQFRFTEGEDHFEFAFSHGVDTERRTAVEMLDFTMIHMMSLANRVQETYTEHARRCLVSPTLETTSPACRRFSTSGSSVSSPTATVAMNSPSASRLSSSHWRMSYLPSTTPPQTYDACRMSW